MGFNQVTCSLWSRWSPVNTARRKTANSLSSQLHWTNPWYYLQIQVMATKMKKWFSFCSFDEDVMEVLHAEKNCDLEILKCIFFNILNSHEGTELLWWVTFAITCVFMCTFKTGKKNIVDSMMCILAMYLIRHHTDCLMLAVDSFY